jgi:hypothetical protein
VEPPRGWQDAGKRREYRRKRGKAV